jgi:hypothetical protein
MTCPVSGLSDRDIDYTYIRGTVGARGGVPYLTAVIRHMDETALLLPARSCSRSSSSPSGSVQPDRRVLANESGSTSSRVLEAEAQSRYSGLHEIAILFRASVPGASPSPSSSSSPRHINTISLIILVIFSYTLQLSLQTVSVAVVARLGSTALSVTAFSLMLAFVTG